MTHDELGRIEKLYAEMSETELMDVARAYDELTDAAQALLRAEFESRSLQPPLVEEQDPSEVEDPTGYHELVTVATYRDLPEAFVARAVLQQSGIPCFLKNEYIIGIQWSLSNLLGGAMLQVADRDVTRAIEVLSQPMPESFPVDSGEDFVQPVCPRCGSLEVMANDTDRKIKLASTLVSGLPMIVGLPALAMLPKGLWKCNHCGCRWTDDGEPEESADPQSPKPLR
jgi:hypothetical protein